MERQSGPGDRSLGGDRSGGSSGTGPARHEGRRLRQECRQNRGGELNLMRRTAVNEVGALVAGASFMKAKQSSYRRANWSSPTTSTKSLNGRQKWSFC